MIEKITLQAPDLAHTPYAVLAVIVFAVAYLFVLAEELIDLRKSKPVVLASGIIWVLVAVAWIQNGLHGVDDAVRHNLLDFAELFFFLLAAMTFVNTLQERGVFDVLRAWLVSHGHSLRSMFWITGALAFVLSPLIDNLTTTLVMGAVVLAIGRGEREFIIPACINIVVAANAGGAFSPFGDVTTLMVWQHGSVPFGGFFALFLPSLVNWLVPAALISAAVPRGLPARGGANAVLKRFAFWVLGVFAVTVVGTVLLHQFLHLPPFLGMMSGLGLLKILGYFIRRRELVESPTSPALVDTLSSERAFDVFVSMKRVEWDTLLFFYGVVMCIGGLSALGILHLLSTASYVALGPGVTNVLVGVASAVVDNIPIMFAVLSIDPAMSEGQWLLVTFTAGVGGSLLSVGSAAGVALMGQARGTYTFMAHLRWSWAIALGYAASIWVHFLINAGKF